MRDTPTIDGEEPCSVDKNGSDQLLLVCFHIAQHAAHRRVDEKRPVTNVPERSRFMHE